MLDQQSYIFISVNYLAHQVATRTTCSNMTIVFHGRSNGRILEIKSTFRTKKRHKTNQGYNFLVGSFSNKDNVRVPRAPIRQIKTVPAFYKMIFLQKPTH